MGSAGGRVTTVREPGVRKVSGGVWVTRERRYQRMGKGEG